MLTSSQDQPTVSTSRQNVTTKTGPWSKNQKHGGINQTEERQQRTLWVRSQKSPAKSPKFTTTVSANIESKESSCKITLTAENTIGHAAEPKTSPNGPESKTDQGHRKQRKYQEN